MTLIRTFLLAVLYAGVTLGANPVLSEELDIQAVMDMREGDMRKLNFHTEPKPLVTTVFLDAENTEMDLTAFAGKTVLLNFWATWCAPCREEMPALNALQKELGGDDFAVVTIATGRNPVPKINLFFEQIQVDQLPILLDPRQTLAREMGVFGLPMSMILNENGQEIARLTGDAHWNSENAIAILKKVIGKEEGY